MPTLHYWGLLSVAWPWGSVSAGLQRSKTNAKGQPISTLCCALNNCRRSKTITHLWSPTRAPIRADAVWQHFNLYVISVAQQIWPLHIRDTPRYSKMCMCVCVCMYVCMCVNVYVYVYTVYIYLYIYIYICICRHRKRNILWEKLFLFLGWKAVIPISYMI